jgi:hypothetical protein
MSMKPDGHAVVDSGKRICYCKGGCHKRAVHSSANSERVKCQNSGVRHSFHSALADKSGMRYTELACFMRTRFDNQSSRQKL